jgi:hypothetical protein
MMRFLNKVKGIAGTVATISTAIIAVTTILKKRRRKRFWLF